MYAKQTLIATVLYKIEIIHLQAKYEKSILKIEETFTELIKVRLKK